MLGNQSQLRNINSSSITAKGCWVNTRSIIDVNTRIRGHIIAGTVGTALQAGTSLYRGTKYHGTVVPWSKLVPPPGAQLHTACSSGRKQGKREEAGRNLPGECCFSACAGKDP